MGRLIRVSAFSVVLIMMGVVLIVSPPEIRIVAPLAILVSGYTGIVRAIRRL